MASFYTRGHLVRWRVFETLVGSLVTRRQADDCSRLTTFNLRNPPQARDEELRL